jgi:hypothetical protein
VPTTVDLRRELSQLYTAPPLPALVDLPPLSCLMIDGRGDPNTAPEYRQAVQALYAVAYTIRFALRRSAAPVDAPVMPLEGLWWAPDMATFTIEDKSDWQWTMLILQSEHVTIAEQGLVLRGKHHEIHLGDPARTAPERLRTIIRQPVAPA